MVKEHPAGAGQRWLHSDRANYSVFGELVNVTFAAITNASINDQTTP